MRHLSIGIIFGALLLQGCSDRHKETKVTKVVPVQEEISREEVTVLPAPAPVPAPIVKKEAPKKAVVKEEPVLTETIPPEEIMAPAPVIYEEQILIQAEEPRWPKNRGKTYNELQLSDDLDDYPFTPSTDDYNFNERQYE